MIIQQHREYTGEYLKMFISFCNLTWCPAVFGLYHFISSKFKQLQNYIFMTLTCCPR